MAITTLMPAARPVLIFADVRIPRIFSPVNSSAKKTAHAAYGTPGANTCACWLTQMMQIMGLSM